MNQGKKNERNKTLVTTTTTKKYKRKQHLSYYTIVVILQLQRSRANKIDWDNTKILQPYCYRQEYCQKGTVAA